MVTRSMRFVRSYWDWRAAGAGRHWAAAWRPVLLCAVGAVGLPGCISSAPSGEESCGTEDKCAPGYVCLTERCAKVCNNDSDCPTLIERCRDGACAVNTDIECFNDTDCSRLGKPDDICAQGTCVPCAQLDLCDTCVVDSDCDGPADVCYQDQCVNCADIGACNQIDGLVMDADQDGHGTGPVGQQNVGDAQNVAGRIYYVDPTGAYVWLVATGALGLDDCDDTDATAWQLMQAFRDADEDTYTVGPLQQVCSGTALPAGWRVDQQIISTPAGPNSPIAITGDGSNGGDEPWDNPERAAASDNSWAHVGFGFVPGTEISDWLRATNLGFAIPTSAVIFGIQVDIEAHDQGNDPIEHADLKLLELGVEAGVDGIPVNLPMSTDVDRVDSFGGPTELWGTTWTAAEINDPSFGLLYAAETTDSGADLYVDHIQVTVFFEALIEDCDDTDPTKWQELPGYVDADSDGYGTGPLLAVCSGTNLGVGWSVLGGAPYGSAAGPRNPSQAVDLSINGGALPWIIEDNVDASDDVYARVTSSAFDAPTFTESLIATELGFDLPANATIDGFEVVVEAYDTGPTQDAEHRDLHLVKAGVAVGRDAIPTNLPIADDIDELQTFGGPTDLWGTTWTVAEVNSLDFGIAYAAQAAAVDANIYVDNINVRVYYQLDDCDDGDPAVWTMRGGHFDSDGDGFGSGALETFCTDGSLPPTYSAFEGDCDPADGLRWHTRYADGDGDGFGVGNLVCVGADAGYGEHPGDCCDTDASVHPGQESYFSTASSCGGYDYDCSGASTTSTGGCSECTVCGVSGSCIDTNACGAAGTTFTYDCSLLHACGETFSNDVCQAQYRGSACSVYSTSFSSGASAATTYCTTSTLRNGYVTGSAQLTGTSTCACR